MLIESSILEETQHFVEEILTREVFDRYCYHNLEHTKEVVKAAKEIAVGTELDDDETELVLLAAWLHDIGYAQSYQDHETFSKQMAEDFLHGKLSDDKIKTVVQAIEATRVPQRPKDLVGKVVCDADLYHLSTKHFIKKSMLLKKEMEEHGTNAMSDEEWKSETIKFANAHDYFTNYGQFVLKPKKEKNIKKIKKTRVAPAAPDKYIEKLEGQLVKLKNRLDKDKELTPTRGIETMFRITSKNHLTLSGMADNKANIMISVNSIILSIILTVLFRKFSEAPQLIIPATSLTVSSLATIVFAILATRPNVSKGKFTDDDIKNRRTNLLFFGNFHGMGLTNYLWGMKEMMKDSEYLYNSLIKDIYFLGVVLGRKYKLLRISYTIFMFGLIISIFLFLLAQVYPAQFAVSGVESF